MLFTWEELQCMMKLNRAETEKILSEDSCITIDGKSRLMDHEYEFRILMEICQVGVNEIWDVDAFDENVVVNHLIPKTQTEVIQFLFKKYTISSDKVSSSGLPVRRLSVEKIHKIRGYFILRSKSTWECKKLTKMMEYTPYFDRNMRMDFMFSRMGAIRLDEVTGLINISHRDNLLELDPKQIIDENWKRVFAAKNNVKKFR